MAFANADEQHRAPKQGLPLEQLNVVEDGRNGVVEGIGDSVGTAELGTTTRVSVYVESCVIRIINVVFPVVIIRSGSTPPPERSNPHSSARRGRLIGEESMAAAERRCLTAIPSLNRRSKQVPHGTVSTHSPVSPMGMVAGATSSLLPGQSSFAPGTNSVANSTTASRPAMPQ